MINKTYFLILPALAVVVVLYVAEFKNLIESNDGIYGEWSSWSKCRKKCEPSLQGRYRNCTVKPKGKGKPCLSLGPRLETRGCQTICVKAIDGAPGQWSEWGPCLRDCVESTRNRTRKCDNPAPQHNGYPCFDILREIEECPSEKHCPIHGHFGRWTPWSKCSVTCGKGVMIRHTTCVQPKYGGNPCLAQKKNITTPCNMKPCPG